MNVERWGMSERAQEETKWRLGELAHDELSTITVGSFFVRFARVKYR